MKAVADKLTYANVMATLAVFLVLAGGSAYAATHVGKNSVGSRQLKRGAVTPRKLSHSAKAALLGPTGANGASGPQGPRGPEGPRGPQGSSGAEPLVIDASASSVPADETNRPIALSGTTTWTPPPDQVGHLAAQAIFKLATNTTDPPGAFESCSPSLNILDNGERVGSTRIVFNNGSSEATTFATFRPEEIEATIGLLEPGAAQTITAEYDGEMASGCRPGSVIEALRIVVVPQG